MRTILGLLVLVALAVGAASCIDFTVPVEMPELPQGVDCYQDSTGAWHCAQEDTTKTTP